MTAPHELGMPLLTAVVNCEPSDLTDLLAELTPADHTKLAAFYLGTTLLLARRYAAAIGVTTGDVIAGLGLIYATEEVSG
jgi:hypothetical protein